jgi:hypothetical protein
MIYGYIPIKQGLGAEDILERLLLCGFINKYKTGILEQSGG